MADVKNLRILVAEDDDLNLFITMKTIESTGNVGMGFPHGTAAWEYLEKNPDSVDMVILDKMMVQLHGLEFVKRMKEHPIFKNIPIIMQSGDAYPDRIKEAVEMGIDCYITKPFKANELLQVIQDIAAKYDLGNPLHSA